MNSTPETVAFHWMSIHLNGVDLKNKECPGKRRPRATKKVCTLSSDLSGGLCPQPPCPGGGWGQGRRGGVRPPCFLTLWDSLLSQRKASATSWRCWFPEGRHLHTGTRESPVKILAVAATQRLRAPVPTEQRARLAWEPAGVPGERGYGFLRGGQEFICCSAELLTLPSSAPFWKHNWLIHCVFKSPLPHRLRPGCRTLSPPRGGLSCRGARAVGRVGFRSFSTLAQELWLMGLFALQLVGPPWIGDRTCVSSPGRPILYHWDTREARQLLNMKKIK